jgi:hypothetical protein
MMECQPIAPLGSGAVRSSICSLPLASVASFHSPHQAKPQNATQGTALTVSLESRPIVRTCVRQFSDRKLCGDQKIQAARARVATCSLHERLVRF